MPPNVTQLEDKLIAADAAGDTETARAISAQLKQLDTASAPAPAAPAPEQRGAISNFWEGIKKSGLDTSQGAQQIYAYSLGTDEQKAAVNKAIQEAERNPALDTLSGKLGYVAGTIGSFMVPGGVFTKAAAALPKVAAAAPKLAAAARAFSAPATIPEAIAGSAAFEASRPSVQTAEGSTRPFLLNKAIQTAAGGVGGGAAGGISKGVSALAKPLAGTEKAAAEEIVATAERAGFPPMLLSQIRKNPVSTILTEGAAITPGASGPVREIVKPQQEFVQRKAAEAIGSTGARPTGVAIEQAWDAATARGYDPIIKGIQRLEPDKGIAKDFQTLLGKGSTTGLTTPEAIQAAKSTLADVTNPNRINGNRLVDRIQDLRNRMSDIKTTAGEKEELQRVYDTFTHWAERESKRRYGPQAETWFKKLGESRKELSDIRRVTEATDLPTGTFQPGKFARRDVKGSPGRAAGTQTGKLAPLAELSRLSEIIKTPIGSSGTTERWMGSRVLNALALPLGGAALTPLTGQDISTGAAEGLAAFGGARMIGKALTSDILRRNAIRGFPRVNRMAEYMGLPATAMGEAISQ